MTQTGGTLQFACTCGQLAGVLTQITPAAHTHVVCHCEDCRAVVTHLGAPDPGTVSILQTTPDRVRITSGLDHLQVLRLGPKGALRWYAACCNAPLFFTPLLPRVAMVGVTAARLLPPADIGPVRAEGFIPTRDGKRRHKNIGTVLVRMLSRTLSKNFSGDWRKTPFFNEDGTPVRTAHVLTRQERAAAVAALKSGPSA